MKFLRVPRQKTWRFLPCGTFLSRAIGDVYQSALIPRKPPCPKKILVTCLGNKVCARWDKKCIRNWKNMLKKSFRNNLYLPKTGQKGKIEQNAKTEHIKPSFLNYD